jgi:hypothetical protein
VIARFWRSYKLKDKGKGNMFYAITKMITLKKEEEKNLRM